MRLLLLGAGGRVGRALQRSLSPLGELVSLSRSATSACCGDLTKTDALRATIRHLKPNVIINAAAYTAVDRAEVELEQAMAINAVAPGVLAEEARRLSAWLVHYSTDYVFDGSGLQPWAESDPAVPLNAYGRTKLAGEQAIQSVWHRHLIFRTSWVYGCHGDGFIRTLLRLAQEQDEVSVVDDQIGAPTGAGLIADVTSMALGRVCGGDEALAGLYHLAAAGETSWHGYAQFLLTQADARGIRLRVRPDQVRAICSSDYKAVACRPLNSRLDTSKLRRNLCTLLPAWQDGVGSAIGALDEAGLR